MLLRIDPRSGDPLFTQIADQIRIEILTGSLKHGERLPTAQQVSQSLDVNVHTVLSAYQALRDEGLIELRRGRGATVSHARQGAQADHFHNLQADIRALVQQANELNLSQTGLLNLVTHALAHQ